MFRTYLERRQQTAGRDSPQATRTTSAADAAAVAPHARAAASTLAGRWRETARMSPPAASVARTAIYIAGATSDGRLPNDTGCMFLSGPDLHQF